MVDKVKDEVKEVIEKPEVMENPKIDVIKLNESTVKSKEVIGENLNVMEKNLEEHPERLGDTLVDLLTKIAQIKALLSKIF